MNEETKRERKREKTKGSAFEGFDSHSFCDFEIVVCTLIVGIVNSNQFWQVSAITICVINVSAQPWTWCPVFTLRLPSNGPVRLQKWIIKMLWFVFVDVETQWCVCYIIVKLLLFCWDVTQKLRLQFLCDMMWEHTKSQTNKQNGSRSIQCRIEWVGTHEI